MKTNNESIVRINQSIVPRLRDHQRGQGNVGFFVLLAIGLLVVGALVIDVGRLYYGYQQLVAQTQAAALAAGTVMANEGETASEAQATATSYSGVSGDLNANSALLTNVTITSTPKCLTTLTNEGIPCTAYTMGDNAIQVTEKAVVPTTFARLMGINSWNISATATAAAKGGFSGPYNLAIVLDTTASMGDTDSDSLCNASRLSCALSGIETLLSTLSPCAGGLASCGAATPNTVNLVAPASGTETAYNVTKPVDEVGLFVFPGLTSASVVSDDLACPVQNPPITSYNGYFSNSSCTASGTPAACCTGKGTGSCSTTATPPVYQIIPLSSDYRTSDTAALYISSKLVIATGGGCSKGVGNPGGEGTFYAGVIDAAQANLVANARPNTQNVIILVSDGAANATTSEGMKEPSPAPSWAYPNTGQCMQAVTEAQKAASAGTTVYSVAYGAEAGTTSCSTDTSPKMTPCQTMEGIANSPNGSGGYVNNLNDFFSDYTAKGSDSSCISASNPVTGLNNIFKVIAEDLTVARLIPNGTL